jgi:hypothetical protein
MHTIKLQLDDNLYEDITQSGIDIKEKFKEFLMDFIDDGYPSISTKEAKKRVSEAVEDYQKNGIKNFNVLDNTFWEDTEKRLLDRHKVS